MKRLLTIGLLSGFLFHSLNTAGQKKESMQGVYSMITQTVNTGGKDSVSRSEQIKFYTDGYMVYSHPLAGDSLAGYGVGTYKMTKEGLTEYVFYTSEGGAHNDTFQLNIKKTNVGYMQMIDFTAENGTKYLLTESYKNIGKNMTSPLDGAWKQTKWIYTPKNGRAIINATPTQFKVYQSGNFVWVNTYKDSASNKPASAFGYGNFVMKGPKKAVEINTNSTYASQLAGKPVTLQVEFISKNAYKQTITAADGATVEFYERLK